MLGRCVQLVLRRLTFSVAGVVVALTGAADLERDFVSTHLSGFLSEASPDVTLEVSTLEDPPRPEEPVNGLDVDVELDGPVLRARRRDFDVRADLEAGVGNVAVAPGRGALSSALRIVLSRLLPMTGRGFLLHGGGTVVGGRTWVFFGRSGAGKSTVASQLLEWPVLSDEIVAIGFDHLGSPVAWGTPFSGTLDTPGESGGQPVSALFELHKGTRLLERQLEQTRARAAVLECTLLFGDAGQLAATLLDLVDEVCRKVPVSELVLPARGAVRDFLAKKAELWTA